ncbi:CHAT domain-containing protein, partial [Trichothermofontia sp.]
PLPTLKQSQTVIQHLYAEKERLWQQLRQRDPVLAGQLEVTPLDLSTLQHLIPDTRTALLSFYSTNDHTHILILRHSPLAFSGSGAGGEGQLPSPSGRGAGGEGFTCTLHTCTNQGYRNLQTWIRDQWLKPYNPHDTEQLQQWLAQMPSHLQELAQRLQLDTLIADHLQGIDELILIPHIYLHLIPFAALPLSPGGRREEREERWGGELQQAQYLGDRFRLRLIPSAQILSYCQQRPTQTPQSLGLVEDATGDLIAARYECDAIAQLHQPLTQYRLQGPHQATVAAYRQLTQTHRVHSLHSSHHASSVLDKPLESALALGDGSLTLGQLMSPGWRMPDLLEVFLSCCETALGNPTITDDLLTLSAGFLCAGARSVISTLWSVDVTATALFCIYYYRYRQAGCDRPTALQQAQQDLRTLSGQDLENAIDPIVAYLQQAQQDELVCQLYNLTQAPTPPFAAPYYWAAFTCHGLR